MQRTYTSNAHVAGRRHPLHLRAACRSRLPLLVVHASSQPSTQNAPPNYKRAAAIALVERFVKPNMCIAFGSGELVNLTIEEVGLRLASGSLRGVQAMPACEAAAHEAAFHGVPVAATDTGVQPSLLVEQADQVDLAAGAAIKGVCSEPQQPQLPRLRMFLQEGKGGDAAAGAGGTGAGSGSGSACRVVLLVEESAVVPRLRGVLPVVVESEGWEDTAEELDDIFIGDAEVWRRADAGTGPVTPRGGDSPYCSAEGHNILDLRFENTLVLVSEEAAYSEIASEIESVPGVVTHGMLLGAAQDVVVARRQGGPLLQGLPQQ